MESYVWRKSFPLWIDEKKRIFSLGLEDVIWSIKTGELIFTRIWTTLYVQQIAIVISQPLSCLQFFDWNVFLKEDLEFPSIQRIALDNICGRL